ncbi:hypothetical protein [Nonomuraea sp. NPDC048901]|uniref:hypothetical protein n=1 Tax=Nonomuraea sp. NPDC048901 TaxID=3155627 RepID=UPI003401FA77
MAALTLEAVRRIARDVTARVQPYRLVVAAAGSSVLGVAVLAYFGLGAFLLGASCMFVGATFGGLAGFDLARSRYTAELARAEHEAARLAADLYVHATTIEDQRRVIAKRDKALRLSDERAASHLDALNELRREVSGG